MGRWLAEFKKEPHEQAAFDKKPQKVIDFEAEALKVQKVLAKQGIAPIRSNFLDGEIIYFARKRTAAGKAPKGDVVYTMAELMTLVQHPPDRKELQEIHRAKKIFGGELIDLDKNENTKLHMGKGTCNHTNP